MYHRVYIVLKLRVMSKYPTTGYPENFQQIITHSCTKTHCLLHNIIKSNCFRVTTWTSTFELCILKVEQLELFWGNEIHTQTAQLLEYIVRIRVSILLPQNNSNCSTFKTYSSNWGIHLVTPKTAQTAQLLKRIVRIGVSISLPPKQLKLLKF